MQGQTSGSSISEFVREFVDSVNEFVVKPAQAKGKTPKVLMTSGGQLAGLVIIDLFSRYFPSLDLVVLNVDTLHTFRETNDLLDALNQRYKLNLHIYTPLGCSTKEEFIAKFGSWETLSADEFGQHSKLEPYARALKELNIETTATGRRRDQGGVRTDLPVWEEDKTTLNPLSKWTWDDVVAYLKANHVPTCSLHREVYVSEIPLPHKVRTIYGTKMLLERPYFHYSESEIRALGKFVYVWKSFGDSHTSAPVLLEDEERSGRFFDDPNKTECGIHFVRPPPRRASQNCSAQQKRPSSSSSRSSVESVC